MKKLLILFVLLISLVGCSSFNKKVYTDDEIIAAVVVDDVYMLNRAIKNGFNINEELKSGDTLLSLALKEDSLQIFSSLLTNGVNLEKDLPAKKIAGINTEISSRPPIFYVSSKEALDIFIQEKANLNTFTTDGELLINYYIKTKPQNLVVELIKNNVQLKVLDSSGWYPIFWAVNIEDKIIIEELLKKDKSQLLLKDKKGNYPIYYANSEDSINILLTGEYNVNEKNIYGENILGEVYLKVKKLGYNYLEKKLLEKGVNPNYTSYR
ncbi:MAG: hypothetical protein ACRCZR_02660 [Cetobacterium sp.]